MYFISTGNKQRFWERLKALETPHRVCVTESSLKVLPIKSKLCVQYLLKLISIKQSRKKKVQNKN